MSLVNDMLLNLDRRDAAPSTELLGARVPWLDEPRRARPRWLVHASVGAAVIAGIAVLTVPWQSATLARVEKHSAPPAVAVLPVPEIAVPLPADVPAPSSPPPVARVEHLALTEMPEGARLTLELSRSTAHRLERSADRRVVDITFADAELGADLPELQLRGTPVETFESERVDGALRIRLTTSRPVRAHSVIRGSDSVPRFELDLLTESTAPAPERETAKLAVPVRESVPRPAPELAPAETHSRTARIELLLRGGQIDAAQAEIEAGRAQSGDDSAFAVLAARAWIARGDADAALAELERNPPELARSPEHHALLAAMRERVGRHAAAAETYRSLLMLDATRAEWWLGLALAREGEGRSRDALAAYRSASRLPGLGNEAARWVNERVAALSPGG